MTKHFPASLKLRFEPPPVYFMHVPKTGGSSIGQWLKSVYRGRDYIDLDIPQIAALHPNRLPSFRCYHSWHHGREMLEFIGRRDAAVFTILREPIERSVSAYDQHKRWLRTHASDFRPEYVASMEQKFGASIDDCHALADIVVPQTMVLGGRRDYRQFFTNLAAQRAAGEHRTLLAPYGIPRMPGEESPNDAFKRTVQWVRSMPIVGLTERLHETTLLVADLLGVPAPATLPRVNPNPMRQSTHHNYRDTLSPAVLAQLQTINKYDFELYAIARDLFEQQWAQFQKRRSRTFSIAPRLRSIKRTIERILPNTVRRATAKML